MSSSPVEQTTPALESDPRFQGTCLLEAVIFRHALYEITARALSSGLLVARVFFRDENLGVLIRVSELQLQGTVSLRQEIADCLVAAEKRHGLGAWDLIREAKQQLQIPFTLRDRAAFRMAGLNLPKPPKEFWN